MSVWASATATLLIRPLWSVRGITFPAPISVRRDRNFDSVMIDQKDLDAMAYLASLPGLRHVDWQRQHGRHRVDNAVAAHPLWTPADYPLLTGPGYHRFIFWLKAQPEAISGTRAIKSSIIAIS